MDKSRRIGLVKFCWLYLVFVFVVGVVFLIVIIMELVGCSPLKTCSMFRPAWAPILV